MLGLGAAEAPGRDDLINWLRGTDVSDADGDGVDHRRATLAWATR